MASYVFDEALYLELNTDVADAVAVGIFDTGWEHYEKYGLKENRPVDFDEAQYLAMNPDVKAAVKAGSFASGKDHFIDYGRAEGRAPIFNNADYLEINPDVAKAVDNGDFSSGLDHYVKYGRAEGRFTEFDEDAYLATYAKVKAAVDAGDFTSGLDHFIKYGKYDGHNPYPAVENVDPDPDGETYTLTTGIDAKEGTSGDDIFIGGAAGAATDTINLGDTIDGKAGTDTFKMSVSGNTAIPGIQTTAVENYEITSAGNDTLALNGNTTGLEKVTLTGGANSTFGLTNVDAGVTVALNNDDNQVTIGYTGTTGETAVNLEVNGAKTNSEIHVGAGVETVNLATSGKDSTLNVLNDNGVAADLAKVVVTGDKALTITTALEAAVKTFDASAATGNITVKTADTAADLSFKFGTGDDKFQIDQSGYTATDVVEMGEGTDTLVLDFANAATGTFNTDVSSKTSGVEVIEVTSDDTAVRTHTVDVGATKLGVSQLVVNGDAGDTFNLNKIADNSTVTYKSNYVASALTLATNGSADTVNIVLDGTTATGALASTGMETVNLTSQKDDAGNTNTLVSFADAATTKMVLDGAADLVGGNITLKADAEFDANAYTGDLTATTFVSALKTYTGGSGKDEITTTAGNVKQGYTFAGGDGTDKLSTTATQDQNAGLLDVTGFETLALTVESGNTDTYTADFRNVTDLETLQVTGNVDGDTVNLLRLGADTTVKFSGALTAANLTANSGTSVATEVNGNIGTLTLDAGTESLSIKGYTGGTTFTTISGTSLASIEVTGDQAINLGTLPTTVTSVDGSAMTGALTADLTSTTDGNTLLGGSAGDTLTDSAKNDTINGNAGADTISLAGGGNDKVLIDSQAESRASTFAGGDLNLDKADSVASFDGNGSAAGDAFQLGTTADAFGTNLTFTSSTTANVNALTVAGGAVDIDTFMAQVETGSAGVASTSGTAQIYDVTLTTGLDAAGSNNTRVLIINDGNATLDANDTIINITGVAEALNAADFVFA